MDVPRRQDMERMSYAEHAMLDAVWLIEDMGADIDLTEAINLIHAARTKVADFIDNKESSSAKRGNP